MLLFNLGALIAAVSFAVHSREKVEYKLYAAAAITIFLCKETMFPLQSMVRYVLMIFPAYAGFTQSLHRPWLQKRFVIVCVLLFALNLTLLWMFLDWWLVV